MAHEWGLVTGKTKLWLKLGIFSPIPIFLREVKGAENQVYMMKSPQNSKSKDPESSQTGIHIHTGRIKHPNPWEQNLLCLGPSSTSPYVSPNTHYTRDTSVCSIKEPRTTKPLCITGITTLPQTLFTYLTLRALGCLARYFILSL